jgi:Patatin-like phospholipase
MGTDDKEQTIPPDRRESWLRQLRVNLDQNVFFWITLLIALYIFLEVPQVTNIWQQEPPWQSGVRRTVLYLAFIAFLIGFYALSMFVVIRRFPVRWVQNRVEKFVNRQVTAWRQLGRRRFRRPLYWLAAVTWRAPDLCCRWLVWSVSNPARRQSVPKLAVCLFVIGAVGSTGLLLGTRGESSRWYPLAGAFCQNMALLSLAATVWLLVAIRGYIGGADRPGKTALYFGRFIAWLISTVMVGELIWVLAYSNWRDNLVSYRLYTIWAVFQLLTSLVIVGLLIDRWHDSNKRWPVRQIAAILLVPGAVWAFSRSSPVGISELDHHLSRDQIGVWKTICQQPNGPKTVAWHARWNDKWFDHFESRIRAVPEQEPVVIVAASGGGSRAAIFAQLVLETLARTPTARDPASNSPVPISNDLAGPKQRTWASNIVLISSVSGGSLATAYHLVHQPAPVPESPSGQGRILLNTSSVELKHWTTRYAGDLIQAYLEEPPQGFPTEMLRSYYQKEVRSREDPNVAVATLLEAEPALRKRLDRIVTERIKREAALASETGAPPNPDALAQEILELSESAAAIRTVLALAEGYQSLGNAPADPIGSWLWSSLSFDEMCVDFMAPLARGAMTPLLDRGDALARFWTHRFGWSDCTNFSGYHGQITDWNYGPERPSVIFNAVDVARGSRLMVGFPPLPSDLWDAVYQRGVTREVPRPLNAAVSLARAVRMSSNFPYGFRAMELETPARSIPDPAAALKSDGGAREPTLEPVHVLDGGVVDNTGLDTLYEISMALEYHADPKSRSKYQAAATRLLASLRQHGVCVLEIDAGAKPNTDLPARLNPLGGITEQNQALENGGYSNADRVKQLYLKEIRRVLTQGLDETGQNLTAARASFRDLEDGLPPTALHYCFQCNHYQPGHGADPAIMTAWALGPRDKAEVVARFLPELSLWNQRREQLWSDVHAGKVGVARARRVAHLRILLSQVTALSQLLQRISLDLAELEGPARAGRQVPQDKLAKLRGQFGEANGRMDALATNVGREKDAGLSTAWKDLGRQVKEDDDRLTLLETARTAKQRAEVQSELGRKPDLAQRSQALFGQIQAGLQAAETGTVTTAMTQLQQRIMIDPQSKYDQGARQAKEVYEKRSTSKGRVQRQD